MRGRIWVHQEDFAIVRMEGSPAKNPSFWTRKVEFTRRYQKHGPFWLTASIESESEVLIAGKSSLKIEYSDYVITQGESHQKITSLAKGFLPMKIAKILMTALGIYLLVRLVLTIGPTALATQLTTLGWSLAILAAVGSGEAWAAHLELAGSISGRWGSDDWVAALRGSADLANIRISLGNGITGGRSPQAPAAERHGRHSSQHSGHSCGDGHILVHVLADHSCRSIRRNSSWPLVDLSFWPSPWPRWR